MHVNVDGMSLKDKLRYDEVHNKIQGFVDLGEYGNETPGVAKQAVQFMIRGVATRWKHPLGCFFLVPIHESR